jgi:hypothetical protein
MAVCIAGANETLALVASRGGEAIFRWGGGEGGGTLRNSRAAVSDRAVACAKLRFKKAETSPKGRRSLLLPL